MNIDEIANIDASFNTNVEQVVELNLDKTGFAGRAAAVGQVCESTDTARDASRSRAGDNLTRSAGRA